MPDETILSTVAKDCFAPLGSPIGARNDNSSLVLTGGSALRTPARTEIVETGENKKASILSSLTMFWRAVWLYNNWLH